MSEQSSKSSPMSNADDSQSQVNQVKRQDSTKANNVSPSSPSLVPTKIPQFSLSSAKQPNVTPLSPGHVKAQVSQFLTAIKPTGPQAPIKPTISQFSTAKPNASPSSTSHVNPNVTPYSTGMKYNAGRPLQEPMKPNVTTLSSPMKSNAGPSVQSPTKSYTPQFATAKPSAALSSAAGRAQPNETPFATQMKPNATPSSTGQTKTNIPQWSSPIKANRTTSSSSAPTQLNDIQLSTGQPNTDKHEVVTLTKSDVTPSSLAPIKTDVNQKSSSVEKPISIPQALAPPTINVTPSSVSTPDEKMNTAPPKTSTAHVNTDMTPSSPPMETVVVPSSQALSVTPKPEEPCPSPSPVPIPSKPPVEPKASQSVFLENSKYLNILLLGMTGVGKTTWINALDNYFKFKSLKEAEENPQFLIPFQFTMMDEDYNEIVIKCPGKSDDNSVKDESSSLTQQSKMYEIHTGSKIIRLIDTPGFAQPSGIAQDLKNFDNVMNHLKSGEVKIQNIHAILIFLKPNEARLDYKFQFCLKNLMAYLPRDAHKNLIFCYTFTRGNSYRPGETLTTLKSFFSQLPDVSITLDKSTMYCFDNEAIRYLGAKLWSTNSKKVDFAKEQSTSSNLSWQTSDEEAKRLLNHISSSSIQPISSAKIVAINEIQNLVHLLRGPIVELCLVIQDNIQNVQNFVCSKEDVQKLFKLTSIRFEKLSCSKTVCTSIDCPSRPKDALGSASNADYLLYPNVCHENCQIVNFGVLGSPNACDCFEGAERKSCKNCKCDYAKHTSINFQMTIEESNRDVTTIENLFEQFKNENEKILKVGKTIRAFLKKNALVMYSDPILEYIEQRVQVVKESVDKVKNIDDKTKQRRTYKLQKIDNILEQYRNCVEGQESIHSKQDIFHMIETLGQLPLMGKSIRSLVTQARQLTDESDKGIQDSRNIQRENLQKSPQSQFQTQLPPPSRNVANPFNTLPPPSLANGDKNNDKQLRPTQSIAPTKDSRRSLFGIRRSHRRRKGEVNPNSNQTSESRRPHLRNDCAIL